MLLKKKNRIRPIVENYVYNWTLNIAFAITKYVSKEL